MIIANALPCYVNQTVGQLLAGKVLDPDFTVTDFVEFRRDDADSSNRDRILRNYTADEEVDNLNKPDDQLLVKAGTVLYIPVFGEKRGVLDQTVPEQFVLTEFKPFMANALANLLRDKAYVNELVDAQGRTAGRVVANEVTVLLWVRSLTALGDNSQAGKWVNISPFVSGVNINSVGAGTTFSLTMQPLVCTPSKDNGWDFESRVKTSGGDSVVSEHVVKLDPSSGDYKRNDFMFHTVVQQNDLVLIKLERLALEKRRPLDVQDMSAADVVGEDKCYDLIGLVDSSTSTVLPNDVIVTITGRDLTKLLIDDSSIFFPEQFAQNIFSSTGVLAQRNRLELELQAVAAGTYQFKSIDTILKFIFNKYSNIGYVPDQVFGLWGDRAILDKYSLVGNQTTSPKTQSSEVKGGVLTTTESQSDHVFLSDASELFLNEARRGVWRICELVIDPQILRRVLVDNNINHDAGSIMNSINKVCQAPFVQFYTDTYGDKFHLIARPAPFDEQGVKGMLYDSIQTELVGGAKEGEVAVLEIDDSQVLREQLTYHEEVYSWFRLIPRGLGINNDQAFFALTPIVTLDKYGEFFGSRPLSIEYNYCPAEFVYGSNYQDNVAYVEAQVFKDLQFLLQSYQYLPFTRRGQITIDGDRRIKKGTWIRYKPTDEVFYVDGVVNVREVTNGVNERFTTLTVTRGMREKFIKGVNVKFGEDEDPKRVSYFNIVRTELPSDASINNRDFLKEWREDEDVFSFFVQRRQWN